MDIATIALLGASAVLTAVLAAASVWASAKGKYTAAVRLRAAAANVLIFTPAASVVPAAAFYATRPALLFWVTAPIGFGLLWAAARTELTHPGRLTGVLARRRARRTTARRPKYVPKYLPTLRGWLTLALFEDKILWRVTHVVALAGAFTAAAFMNGHATWVVSWLLTAISSVRFWYVQHQRNKKISRIYQLAAANLDYAKAVNSRLSSDGARFASATGCISVSWKDLTTPVILEIAFPVSFAKTDLSKINKFEDELDATLEGNGWKFDWDTKATIVTVSLAVYPELVPWNHRTLEKWSEFYVGDALDNGAPVTFDVNQESPHILVAGETKTGKTEAMFAIAAQALDKGWDVAICDPKETGWPMWSRRRRFTHAKQGDPETGAAPLRPGDARPGVIEHAVEMYGVRDVLSRMNDELLRRKKVNSKHSVVKWTELPESVREAERIVPLLVVIDEAMTMFDLMRGKGDSIEEENAVRQEALSLLQRLVVEARALGIHVMIGIQRPDASILGGAMRSSIGARIACGVMEPQGLEMMFQTRTPPRLKVVNAEGQRVPGRALTRSSPGMPIVATQVAYLGDNQVELDEVAPLPDAPAKEDETPTGAFNPYVQFGEDAPSWLAEHIGAPPWDGEGPSTVSSPEAPPWDVDPVSPPSAAAPGASPEPWMTPTPTWDLSAPDGTAAGSAAGESPPSEMAEAADEAAELTLTSWLDGFAPAPTADQDDSSVDWWL